MTIDEKVEGLSYAYSFTNVLPLNRLGTQHESLESYRKSVPVKKSLKQKYYTLIIVTAQNRRILLGHKLRGFGEGFYNSFGGKIENEIDKSPAHSAVRELGEETNIHVSLHTMQKGSIGTLFFTSADNDVEMVVHLFHVKLLLTCACCNEIDNNRNTYNFNDLKVTEDFIFIDCKSIQKCDEIAPIWFRDWREIPLDNMFADDSVWLTYILDNLERQGKNFNIKLNGFFHFESGGTEINTIMHRFLDTQICSKNKLDHNLTLEKRLFHALHRNDIHSPTIKEFKECWAVAKSVQTFFGKDKFDVIIDVAGGHGALAGKLAAFVRLVNLISQDTRQFFLIRCFNLFLHFCSKLFYLY